MRRAVVLSWLRGKPAQEVAALAGIGVPTLRRWARAYFRSKLPISAGKVEETTGLVQAAVRIRRDSWGIAHIAAEGERDLFFGLGYAMAQDRLWQLDYQRRLVRGELAAVLGRRTLASDRAVRTLGIGAVGDRAWETAPADVCEMLAALAAGINRWMEQVGDRRPVEFEILGYEPAPWRPADSIAIWKHRWWTLTGRLESSILYEAARRTLPPALFDAFQAVELGDETIVPEVSHPTGLGCFGNRGGNWGGGSPDEGSNNWVVGGTHTTTGAPALCSDPHNPFSAPSQWFEAQLTCPEFDAAGAVYIGTPGLYLGRNRSVAWGLTNHAITVRDLYQEEIGPDRPDHYREGDAWRPFEVERQRIAIAGEPDDILEIRRTVRGPIVGELLPRGSTMGSGPEPPISLRWIGAEVPSGFEASLALLRARSATDVLAALRQWPCPPLNYVYADASGDLGYHAAGLVPRRVRSGYGLRRASDPDDAWDGLIPFDELPHIANPPRGWVATANNVPWTRDHWYLESGAWSDGYRAHRIRERLTAKDVLAPEEVAAVQADVHGVRARDLVPALLALVEPADDPIVQQATHTLRRWDREFSVASVGASIWAAFWAEWCLALARARFPEPLVEFAAAKVGEVGRRLLLGEPLPWFPSGDPGDEVRRAFGAARQSLTRWGGPDPRAWRWGKLHQVTHPHPLATTPELAALFSTGPLPTSGGQTVRAAGHGLTVPFTVISGSTYRFLADLSRPDRMVSVQTLGQSAHLGSPHYRDQTRLWLEDRYHPLWMSEEDVLAHLEGETVISHPAVNQVGQDLNHTPTGVHECDEPSRLGHTQPPGVQWLEQ
ncbi:MAG: penicillin acylase family protein [Chloroflexi bacterium]|nr:penicillin acylase family protein [Chloroflexota bacterium]